MKIDLNSLSLDGRGGYFLIFRIWSFEIVSKFACLREAASAKAGISCFEFAIRSTKNYSAAICCTISFLIAYTVPKIPFGFTNRTINRMT